MVQPALFDEYEVAVPERVGRAIVGTRPGSRLLSKSPPHFDYDYTLNPYIGCAFGCSYCFATAFVADEARKRAWGDWVDVKTDALDQLHRAPLREKRIFMSSATDPYQPIEAKLELTRSIVEILAEPERQPYLVVQTRSPLAARDIDLFKRFRGLRVNMSITTDCDAIRRRFEPSCPSIDRRIEALTEVSRAGISTAVCIAPMLPLHDPEAFADRLAGIGATLYVANYFHHSTREFASTTRADAWPLLKEYDWGGKAYEQALERMRRRLPQLQVWGRRFIA